MVTKQKPNNNGRGYFAWNTTMGAYTELEKMMEERVTGCGISAYPHIKSRLKILKNKFVAYKLCRGQSGCGWGWDDVAKCPVVDTEVFNNFVKNHPNCNVLNGKTFPQYEDLLKVFGKVTSRATGKGAIGANEDVNPPSEAAFNDVDTELLNAEGMTRFMENVINEVVDMPTPPSVHNTQPANSASVAGDACDGVASEGVRTRRPAAHRIQLENSISDLTAEITQIRPAIEQAVDIMVNRLLGNDEDSNNMRQQIMTDLKSLHGLTRPQVIDAASILWTWSFSTGWIPWMTDYISF